jgi:hypothetical protein
MVVIGFGSRPNNFLSWLIRAATGGSWSHVWIEWESSLWDGVWVTHAQQVGIVTSPIEVVFEKYSLRRRYGVEDIRVRLGLRRMRKECGKPYDYVTVIYNTLLLVLLRLTGWGRLRTMVLRNAARFTCSEFVALVLKRSGLPGTDRLDPELTTPGALETFCAESRFFTKL